MWKFCESLLHKKKVDFQRKRGIGERDRERERERGLITLMILTLNQGLSGMTKTENDQGGPLHDDNEAFAISY